MVLICKAARPQGRWLHRELWKASEQRSVRFHETLPTFVFNQHSLLLRVLTHIQYVRPNKHTLVNDILFITITKINPTTKCFRKCPCWPLLYKTQINHLIDMVLHEHCSSFPVNPSCMLMLLFNSETSEGEQPLIKASWVSPRLLHPSFLTSLPLSQWIYDPISSMGLNLAPLMVPAELQWRGGTLCLPLGPERKAKTCVWKSNVSLASCEGEIQIGSFWICCEVH